MISRRRILTAGTLAAAGAAVSPATAAAGYSHQRHDLRVPARRWTRLGGVPALGGRGGAYGMQFVLLAPPGGRGPRVARVRFSRNDSDGTGDQTYLVGGVRRYNITHWHQVSGFRGSMGSWLWVDRPVIVLYRILKSRP